MPLIGVMFQSEITSPYFFSRIFASAEAPSDTVSMSLKPICARRTRTICAMVR